MDFFYYCVTIIYCWKQHDVQQNKWELIIAFPCKQFQNLYVDSDMHTSRTQKWVYCCISMAKLFNLHPLFHCKSYSSKWFDWYMCWKQRSKNASVNLHVHCLSCWNSQLPLAQIKLSLLPSLLFWFTTFPQTFLYISHTSYFLPPHHFSIHLY
jgi:hypothetical protein